jgi:hypothetical protein
MRTPRNAAPIRKVYGITGAHIQSMKQGTKSEPFMNQPQSGQCTKRRYTKRGAEMALLETRIEKELHHNQKRREQRAYYHKPCKAWHITKMPLAKGKSNGNTVQEKPGRQESPIGKADEKRP